MSAPTAWYVKRSHPHDGRVGWVGPIRREAQADREVEAWRDAEWGAEKIPATPEARAEVQAWERARNAKHRR